MANSYSLLRLLTPQIGDGLKGLIGCLNRLAVQFERPLRLDQGNQLVDGIDVAGFEVTLKERA
jgi:hypothetical protein